ncbi:hypothetical protein FUSNEC_GEN_9827_03100 [Fusobacterium necrophorum subsp. funduliforme]
MKKLLLCFLLIFILVGCGKEQKAFNEIKKADSANNYGQVIQLGNQFLKTYPKTKKKKEIDDFLVKAEKGIEELKYQDIKKKYDGGNYFALQKQIAEFLEKHPKSSYREELKKIDFILKEKEKKEEEETRRKIEERKKKEEKITNELKKISHTKYDEFRDIKWFYAKDNAGNKTTEREKMYVYGGANGKDAKTPTWFRIKFRYVGSDWVFFNKITLLINGTPIYISMAKGDEYHDVAGGNVYEIFDIPVDGYEEGVLFSFDVSNNIKIRFEGNRGYVDKVLTVSEIQKIRNMYKFIAYKNGEY